MDPQETKTEKLPPAAALLQMMSGFWVSVAIYVVAKLGLADDFAAGPGNVDDLAKKAVAHPGALYRLLRALAGAGIFTELETRCFALTSLEVF